MSIQTNFPAIKPTLLLDFSNTKQLDSRITFTRASTATYYGTQTAKAEENLLLQSQDFTTTWTTAGQNATITADTTAAPDGTTTADTLTDNATSGVHRVAQTITTSNNNQLVLSCFLKYSTLQWVSLSAATNTGQWAGAKFDVQNGVLGSTSQQGTDWTANSSSITSVGNGWYRCVLVFTPGNSGSLGVYVNGATDGTTFTTSQRGSEVYSGTSSAVFLWGAQLEQRSAATAYTATTTQPITNYIPVLETAASGVARFDHNPTTFESLGLEIEEQRTNLLLQSEDFSTTWTNSASTEQTNVIVSPAGTLTGDKIVSDSGSLGYVVQAVSQTSGTSYALSVLAKAGEYSFCQLRINTSVPSTTRAYFNLSNGTTTGAANCTASITPVGNGWYRCSIVYAATVTTASGGQRIYGQVDAADTVGDGYSGIYIWGAQLEEGAFATSYIPTVASQVTRSADAASMTGTNFSSWFNQAEGTLYADYLLSDSNSHSVAEISSGGSDYIRMRYSSGGGAQYVVQVAGVSQASQSPTGFSTPNTQYKRAITYATNSFNQAINGSLPTAEDTSGTVPVSSRLFIGAEGATGSTSQLGGTIKKLAYYPVRLTNAQLQGLTS
jgi:hypothetical protein